MNNYYQVESTLINKKDNIADVCSYTFKRINKIKRKVKYDEYGRIFINDELFFPFGAYSFTLTDYKLELINRTHFNVVLQNPYMSKNIMDKIQQMDLKIIAGLNFTSITEPNPNTVLQKEKNYKKYIVETINEFKDHPNLFG